MALGMMAEGIEDYEKALAVYEKMLAFEMDSLKKSNIHRKMGDICLQIGKIAKNPETACVPSRRIRRPWRLTQWRQSLSLAQKS